MYTLLLSTLLMGAYASPLPLQPESPFSPLTLQTAVHESLAKPKQWHTSSSTPEIELETEFANENLEPKKSTTTADSPSPSETVEMKSWDSRLGDNFRSFMAAVKEKHETIIVEDPTSPEDLTNPSEPANQTKRSVIPKKPKKEPTPEASPAPAPAPAPAPEAEAEAEPEEQPEELELTNEEFDALFAEYASKHDTHNFNSLQTYLDNLLKPTSPSYTTKPWHQQHQQQPTISRRDGSSSNQRFSPDRKPPISISPEVFNRIAADYKFTQNPTAINVEDGFLGRSVANGKGAAGAGGVPASLATQTAGARGKAGLKGGLERRRVGSPCDVLVVGDRIQGHGCDSVVSFFEAVDVFEGRYN